MTEKQLYAIRAIAEKQWEDELQDAVGFDHDGQWITNPWMDPSGRFPQSSYQAVAIYGKKEFKRFCHDIIDHYELKNPTWKTHDYDYEAGVSDSPSASKTIGTVTAWGPNDFSVEWMDLPGDIQEEIYRLLEPYCSSSARGSKKSVMEEIEKALT